MKIIWEKISPDPDENERKEISRELFEKLTSDGECRFWNVFCGGTCRRSQRRAVVGLGYVWTRITRKDPEGRKHIDNFYFDD